MSVDIHNECGVTLDERRLARLATFVLTEMGVSPLVELSVALVDIGYMETLHVQFMDEPGPTDVLAFPMDELSPSRGPQHDDDTLPPTVLGEVVLCPEVAERQGRDAGHSMEDELHLLCTHGILHLLGYDHGEPDEEREMFALQGKLLVAWRDVRDAGS